MATDVWLGENIPYLNGISETLNYRMFGNNFYSTWLYKFRNDITFSKKIHFQVKFSLIYQQKQHFRSKKCLLTSRPKFIKMSWHRLETKKNSILYQKLTAYSSLIQADNLIHISSNSSLHKKTVHFRFDESQNTS